MPHQLKRDHPAVAISHHNEFQSYETVTAILLNRAGSVSVGPTRRRMRSPTKLRRWGLSGFLAVVALLFVNGAQAVELGIFSWQFAPFCNVVTLTAVQNGSVFTLTGSDDNCGSGKRSPVYGSAAANPDGSLNLGLTIIPNTGHAIQSRITLSGGASGSWQDSGGNSGTFVFGPSIPASGSPRPPVILASEPWHEIGAPGEPPFGTGWKNDTPPYICSSPPPQPVGCPVYNTAGFYKDSTGIVHLKGTISFGQSGSTIAFQLPTGYRPAKAAVFTMPTTFNGRFVLYDGNFQLSVDGGFPPGTKYFSLDGISFRAEN